MSDQKEKLAYKASVEKGNVKYTFNVEIAACMALLAKQPEAVQLEFIKKACSPHHGKSDFPVDGKEITAQILVDVLGSGGGKPNDADYKLADEALAKLKETPDKLAVMNTKLAQSWDKAPDRETLAKVIMAKRKAAEAEAKRIRESSRQLAL